METPSPPTLLSTLQPFTAEDTPSSLHPFASISPDSIEFLQNLIKVSHQLSHSLNVHSAISFSNPKLVSIARQEAALEHSLFQSDEHIRTTVSALRTRSGTSYGEDSPLDPAAIPDWVVSRLEAWGTEVGMETFKEDLRENRMTVVLGGKILVLDIDFSVDGLHHSIDIKTVKSSYAVPANGSVNTVGSTSLDGLLAKSIRTFLVSVQQDPSLFSSSGQALEAERLGKVVKDQLAYLMMLDGLAALKEIQGGGIRWFCDGDALSGRLVGFAKAEAGAIASSLLMERAPLDIFLQRAHALPLPCLISPSMSFLLYLSPLTYLALLRTSTLPPTPQSNDGLPKLDIPLTTLRDQLSAHPHPKGATIATLSLVSTSGINPNAGSVQKIPVDGAFPSRPQFTLAQPEIEYTFPANGPHAWILDFTSSGKHAGVLMSQSKMREIEYVLDPSGMGDLGGVGMMGFGNGLNRRNWIDMLLNSGDVHTAQSVERYSASYHSPSDAHPPLQLRLATPDEPGFVLERVEVKTMKEVWGTLEVVREQCWLNEMLRCCDWVPERPSNTASVPGIVSAENPATEALLQAILSGINTPNSIPVEVYLPSTFSPGLPFDVPTNLRQPPKISMTLPEKPPISGLVEIIVAYDQSRPKGVRVEVGGGIGMGLGLDMGAGIDVETLEEVVRRGGIFGLGGRVWKSSSVDT